MRRFSIVVLLFAVTLALLTGCKDTEPEKPVVENNIAVDYFLSNDEFSEGEAVCVRVVFRNETKDTISITEYPLKNLELVTVDGPPVNKVQRAPYARPPRMWLAPGDSSWDIINLTGFYENSGPGMFAPGTYMIKTHTFFYAGEYIRNKLRKYGYRDSTTFTVVPPENRALEAMEKYRSIMAETTGLDSLIGNTSIILPEEVQKKLDLLAAEYPLTPIGTRILINDLGIWYRAVPIERFRKFLMEAPADCPCCLQRYVIDQMVKRYVIKSEREDQLDLVEEVLEKYDPDTPIGAHVRRAYAFRMEDGFLTR